MQMSPSYHIACRAHLNCEARARTGLQSPPRLCAGLHPPVLGVAAIGAQETTAAGVLLGGLRIRD